MSPFLKPLTEYFFRTFKASYIFLLCSIFFRFTWRLSPYRSSSFCMLPIPPLPLFPAAHFEITNPLNSNAFTIATTCTLLTIWRAFRSRKNSILTFRNQPAIGVYITIIPDSARYYIFFFPWKSTAALL